MHKRLLVTRVLVKEVLIVLNAVDVVCKINICNYFFQQCHILEVTSTFAQNVGTFSQCLERKILLPALDALLK